MKILILETSAIKGIGSGGSYQQALYYEKRLVEEGFTPEIFQGRILPLVKAVRSADFILGFGTPLLGVFVHWLAFLYRKKGVFCLDTVTVTSEIIIDCLQHQVFDGKLFFSGITKSFMDNLAIHLPPPRRNLINIFSCDFVREKLKGTFLYSQEKNYVTPVISYDGPRTLPRQKTILFYGALFRGRGILDLVVACRILWNRGYFFKLMILGSPIEPLTEKKFWKLIKNEEKDRIVFRGKVGSPLKFVLQTTVVVLPFRYACSFQPPYTIIEPVKLGIPVITTDEGANGELIVNGQTGFICRRNDPGDLADKIAYVFNHPEEAEKLAKRGQKHYHQKQKQENRILTYFNSFKDEN